MIHKKKIEVDEEFEKKRMRNETRFVAYRPGSFTFFIYIFFSGFKIVLILRNFSGGDEFGYSNKKQNDKEKMPIRIIRNQLRLHSCCVNNISSFLKIKFCLTRGDMQLYQQVLRAVKLNKELSIINEESVDPDREFFEIPPKKSILTLLRVVCR